MKFIIIGMHASGKHEIANQLEEMGMKYGKLFSSVPNINDITNIYAKSHFEQYDVNDVTDVFENNAYIFIQGLQSSANINSFKFFEGLSKHTFDNNDVFVLSPDQLLNVIPSSISEEVCFIWMDGNNANRKNRYRAEKRNYDFNERESIEKQEIHSFVKFLYSFPNSKVLYFNNEAPNRVASIISSLIKYPDLIEVYENNFN